VNFYDHFIIHLFIIYLFNLIYYLFNDYLFIHLVRLFIHLSFTYFVFFFTLLVGLTSGQVLAVHKSVLDPRRPMKSNVSATEKEEGIILFVHLLFIYLIYLCMYLFIYLFICLVILF
jgi:hypothetical protein